MRIYIVCKAIDINSYQKSVSETCINTRLLQLQPKAEGIFELPYIDTSPACVWSILHLPYLGCLKNPEEARKIFSMRELQGLGRIIDDDETTHSNGNASI